MDLLHRFNIMFINKNKKMNKCFEQNIVRTVSAVPD